MTKKFSTNFTVKKAIIHRIFWSFPQFLENIFIDMLKMWETVFFSKRQLFNLHTGIKTKKFRLYRDYLCFQQVGNKCYQHGVESTTFINVNAFILTCYSYINCGKKLFPNDFA